MIKWGIYAAMLAALMGCNNEAFEQEFESSDINRFWEAYDLIIAEPDTNIQKELLDSIYLSQASQGLTDLIEVRRYSPQEFLTAIRSYPEFWNSIKENTLKTDEYQEEIVADLSKLKKLYPDLQPAKVYFSVGAFRTNGTIKDRNVLIGSELALADQNTVINELPDWRQPFYKEYHPLDNLSLLCTHEYVHTQQNELIENLLSMCLYEGVAEFVSCFATGKPSSAPAIEFGKQNTDAVVAKFVEDLYLMTNNYNWLWGENRNELEVRDLGYFIGYEICERYYSQATDKQLAIKELIELDYTNETEVERIVDGSGLLPKTIEELYNDYENKRPSVLRIEEFENGDTAVDPRVSSITVIFSEALNGIHNGLDFGALGPDHYPNVDNPSRKFGADNTSYSFSVQLEPNTKYQMMVGSNFRLENGIRLKPYVIEFVTAEE